MVVFSCLNCGDAVHKPNVEKHFFKCHGIITLSCMDCFKNFDKITYKEHTACISEEQRYAGRDYVPKELSGARKQEGWMGIVKSILQNPDEYALPNYLLPVLKRLQSYDNLPRKQNKFVNFVKNSLHLRQNEIEAVWDVLEKALTKYKESLKKENEQNASTTKHNKENSKRPDDSISENVNNSNEVEMNDDSSTESETKKRKSKEFHELHEPKKKKINEVSDNIKNVENNDIKNKNSVLVAFDWDSVIIKIVGQHPSGILVSELKKKVLKKFKKHQNNPEISQKIHKIFYKMLGKSKEILFDGEIVKLLN